MLATRLDISPTEAESLLEDILAQADIGLDPITDDVGKLAIECFTT